MFVRFLLSEWFGLFLTAIMTICVTLSVHDDRQANSMELRLAYLSMSFVITWLIVVGFQRFASNMKSK